MSAPLNLTPTQVAHLAEFMKVASRATAGTGVRIEGYGAESLTVGDVTVGIRWDDDACEYTLNDRIGS
ncbi:hypothetical protein [Aeromicrobium sp. UC242_57]|uniref:hypothetical protein n=1 Tax=Aeromicrobium sp. UC242_57 TaxID=3374624 RepID=UPI00378CF419